MGVVVKIYQVTTLKQIFCINIRCYNILPSAFLVMYHYFEMVKTTRRRHCHGIFRFLTPEVDKN